MRVDWTNDRIIRLKELWHEGYSGQQIADIMALGCSRSAILGKINSLGLTRKMSKRKPKTKPLPFLPADKVMPPEITGDTRKKFIELKFSDCRFMLGDARDPDVLYCGANTGGLHAFCKHHREICYVKNSARKR